MCVTTVTMVMLLRDFGPYGIQFMTLRVFANSDILGVLDVQLPSITSTI
jgi:hypothetical protein